MPLTTDGIPDDDEFDAWCERIDMPDGGSLVLAEDLDHASQIVADLRRDGYRAESLGRFVRTTATFEQPPMPVPRCVHGVPWKDCKQCSH
jgi:hypothetical protein